MFWVATGAIAAYMKHGLPVSQWTISQFIGIAMSLNALTANADEDLTCGRGTPRMNPAPILIVGLA